MAQPRPLSFTLVRVLLGCLALVAGWAAQPAAAAQVLAWGQSSDGQLGDGRYSYNSSTTVSVPVAGVAGGGPYATHLVFTAGLADHLQVQALDAVIPAQPLWATGSTGRQ